MLNNFSIAWNNLYKNHQSQYLTGSVTIVEEDDKAKNKSLTVNVTEAVSFPSKDFNSYDMFSAFTDRNCDGVLLVLNSDGTYDMLFIEMKSRFSTTEVFKAKGQIVETFAKIQSLLRMMKEYASLPIKRVYGVIETKALDEDQENWWSKQQYLPDEELQFGELLLKYIAIDAPTCCKEELNMPSTMKFTIIFSEDDNYVVNYTDISVHL